MGDHCFDSQNKDFFDSINDWETFYESTSSEANSIFDLEGTYESRYDGNIIKSSYKESQEVLSKMVFWYRN